MKGDIANLIKQHEGCRLRAYQDTLGVWTIGYGHNLQAKSISMAAAEQIFADDLKDAEADCMHAFPWYADLTESRQAAMVDLCFNLGLTGLRKFVKFLAAMERGDYETAAIELLDSLWAKQVKSRAFAVADLIRGTTEV